MSTTPSAARLPAMELAKLSAVPRTTTSSLRLDTLSTRFSRVCPPSPVSTASRVSDSKPASVTVTMYDPGSN